MTEDLVTRIRTVFEDTPQIMTWFDEETYVGAETRAHISGMWETLKDAADRIEQLEKYASLHAKCEQTSLEYEQKLVNRLRDAHKRIRQLEGILKRAVDGYVQANSVETLNFDWLDDAEAALKENSL